MRIPKRYPGAMLPVHYAASDREWAIALRLMWGLLFTVAQLMAIFMVQTVEEVLISVPLIGAGTYAASRLYMYLHRWLWPQY